MPKRTSAASTIRLEVADRVATVTLARPEIHNAFNEVMIAELNDLFAQLAEDPSVRVVVLTGAGKSFCAGADLHWMGKMVSYSFEENFEDSMKLAELMHRMYAHPCPTICRVNGATVGGGTGLVAACDIAIASTSAFFSLSEVRIGLVPACIGPYVVKRIGEARARELFLTGERIPAEKAAQIGLVNAAVPEADLDSEVRKRVELMLKCGPEALKAAKKLLEGVTARAASELKEFTAEMIAQLRVSEEGQEGMKAFLAKRTPRWALEGGSK